MKEVLQAWPARAIALCRSLFRGRCPPLFGFPPPAGGGSLLAGAPEVTKRARPCHPAPAAPGFLNVILASGVGAEGASLRLDAFRGIHAAQPLTQGLRSAGQKGRFARLSDRRPGTILQATRCQIPVSRPSAGAVQGVNRQGCRFSRDGPGMALRGDPRNSAGARVV